MMKNLKTLENQIASFFRQGRFFLRIFSVTVREKTGSPFIFLKKPWLNLLGVLERERVFRYKMRWIFILLMGTMFLLIPMPRFSSDYSTVILDKDGHLLHVFLNQKDQWCLPLDPHWKIPQKLQKTVLEYEDRWFFWHFGVNPISLVRALWQNISSGEIQSGASTITMQVARLAKPKPRTLSSKLLEIFQAFKLELFYSKKTILHMYFEHAPYGRNVIGIRAGALRYFGKEPEALSWAECASLAILPNSPGLIAPGVRTELFREKRNRLLRRLYQRGYISSETLSLALLEPVPNASRPFFATARHLARRLEADPDYKGKVIRTTLQKDIQLRVEELVLEHVRERLEPFGIYNACALVVETATGKVRAYVGSPDFFDEVHDGQVDGVLSPRSSGSLLKPFLYALAMDAGFLLPQTKLKDVPTFYGAFSPVNANETYDGLVTAKEALIRSLNVPAVRLLYTYGLHSFYYFLKKAGVSTLFRTPEEYGLPLILGGAEVRAWDMAILFRGLGNGGKFGSLQVIEEEESSPTISLISPGACYLTLQMLQEVRRPEAEYYWQWYQNAWPMAWKTGTSFGQRDAWAVGVSPSWTIVVWAGNFKGEGNPNLSGAFSAGTLLFLIFNSLRQNPQKVWFEVPAKDLKSLPICTETGFPAGPYCEHTQVVDAPRGMKPIWVCPYHKRVYLSTRENITVCSACWEPGAVRSETRLIYPPEVAQFLRERGITVGSLPPHNPRCAMYSGSPCVEILYPTPDAKLFVPRDLDAQLEKVTFRVAHQALKSRLYWYLDGHFLGTTHNRHVLAWSPRPGEHTLYVIDESGQDAKVSFSVYIRDKLSFSP